MVTLDWASVVDNVAARLGLPGSVGSKLVLPRQVPAVSLRDRFGITIDEYQVSDDRRETRSSSNAGPRACSN